MPSATPLDPSFVSGGFLLELLTESFAVRALLGSLAAVVLTGLAVRFGRLRSTRARRVLVLAPVLTAAAAAVATALEAGAAVYLPQLWVTTTATSTAAQILDIADELRSVARARQLDLLLLAYAAVVSVLLARRLLGGLAVRRLLRRGSAPDAERSRLLGTCRSVARQMHLRVPRVRLVAGCPGGAFAHGTLRPLVAVDPALVGALDDRELEGLVAHEMAHLRRRDPLLNTVVGLFRDLTFFLPTVHLAAHWLRTEQEESADEVAARVTARPASLASSILKVWDRPAASGPRVACAAVPHGALRLAGGGVLKPRSGHGGASSRVVTRRVQRLIAGQERISRRRRAAEAGLAAAVLVAATGTALTVPGWIVERWGTEALALGYLPAVPDTLDESPVFSTFRQLTADAPRATTGSTAVTERTSSDISGCPCVESQAQLRQHVAATAPPVNPRLVWMGDGHRAHEVLDTDDVSAARTLFAFNQDGPQVGVFLVNAPRTRSYP